MFKKFISFLTAATTQTAYLSKGATPIDNAPETILQSLGDVGKEFLQSSVMQGLEAELESAVEAKVNSLLPASLQSDAVQLEKTVNALVATALKGGSIASDLSTIKAELIEDVTSAVLGKLGALLGLPAAPAIAIA
jgi:hypothetical protein